MRPISRLRWAFGLLLGGGALAAALAWAGRKTITVVTLALIDLVAGQIVVTGSKALAPVLSSAELVRAIERQYGEFDSGAMFFSVGKHDQTLPFYLKCPVMLVGYTDEFEMGVALLEPAKAIADKADFYQRWNALGQAYAMMRPETFDAMTKAGLPLVLLGRDSQRVIVSGR